MPKLLPSIRIQLESRSAQPWTVVVAVEETVDEEKVVAMGEAEVYCCRLVAIDREDCAGCVCAWVCDGEAESR